jgi:hypothetical protein
MFKSKSFNEESEDEFSDGRSEDHFSSVVEEPQDLSQSSSSQAKMDVDTDEREDLSESEDEDSRQVVKKPRTESPSMENVEQGNGYVVTSYFLTKCPVTLIFFRSHFACLEPATIQSTSSIRPPIIVTRRKVAAVIDAVTANVLAKNKKASLSECVSATPETPLTLLPQNFYSIANAGEGTSAGGEGSSATVAGSAGGDQAYFTTAGTSSTSPGKSVIVRAGPSSAVSPLN